MERCCFCEGTSSNHRHFQRLFGTASDLLRAAIVNSIYNLFGAYHSLEDTIPPNGVICKDCRSLFLNLDKKQSELHAFQTKVRSLLREVLPFPEVSPLLPVRAGQSRPTAGQGTSTPKRLCFEGSTLAVKSPSVQVAIHSVTAMS